MTKTARSEPKPTKARDAADDEPLWTTTSTSSDLLMPGFPVLADAKDEGAQEDEERKWDQGGGGKKILQDESICLGLE